MKRHVQTFFRHPFWSDWRTVTAVYALIPIIIGLMKWTKENDTYQIYKSVFWNTINQLPLYEFYDYLKGMTGFVIWYVTAPWKRGRWNLVLLIYAFILTSLCTSDIFFPRIIWKQQLEPYALKALPTAIICFYLIYDMNTKDYKSVSLVEKKSRRE